MTDWQKLTVADDRTHHCLDGQAAYEDRFDDVLKFHAPGLAPVQRGPEAWHISTDGSAAYQHRYRRTFGFYEGFAAVVGDDGWLHVGPDGSAAYDARYDWCGNFQGGRCAVRDADGRYLHIKPAGEPAYSQHWHYVGDFRDGVAVVQGSHGASTHIDRNGALVHGRWFRDVDVYHKGFARARDEEGWMHVDHQGAPAYSARFAAVEPFYNGQARVERFDGSLAVIDEAGRTTAELRPPLRSEFEALSADMVGYWRTRTIAAAVELGIAEELPASAGGVARQLGLSEDRAERFLRALGELSLVRQEAGLWHLTRRGAYLSKDHSLTLADAALEYAGQLGDAWASLAGAVRGQGEPRRPEIFAAVAADPQRCKTHHRMLSSYARHDYEHLVPLLDLAGTERVIDAGGGVGALADILLARHPRLQVTVLDLPEVIAQRQRDGSGRLHLHGGDLFAPWDVRGTVVVLARVLHDWDDADALRILCRARESLSVGDRLFVVEMVLPKDSTAGALCDLHLLVATGGRERTAEEFRILLERSGFHLEDVRQTAGVASLIAARAT